MPEWLIAVGKQESIVPAEAWVKVQHVLDAKREKSRSIVRTPYKSEALRLAVKERSVGYRISDGAQVARYSLFREHLI